MNRSTIRSISQWLIALGVLVLAVALYSGSPAQKSNAVFEGWPSPANDKCLGSEEDKQFFQKIKAGMREDPLNFALINGTTWTVVNRSDNSSHRSDLGTDVGIFRLAMLCEDYAVREGFYDVIFEMLDNVDKFPPEQGMWVEMKVWVTFSDHSMTGTGAIADRGGPNAGVELMVRRLQANPEPRKLLFLGQLTLRYEIQVNLMGLLTSDVDNRRGAAAMAAGAAEELVRTMRMEYDLCSPLFTACACMNSLILHHRPYAAKFKELGAPGLAAMAARQCDPPVSDILLLGFSFGHAHPARETCAYSASLF